MSWLALALIGHVANGVAFAIDKILLRTAFSHSATYAGIVGMLSTLIVVAIPYVTVWPSGTVLVVTLVSGATFVLALWAFFAALARAEASRVVPIVGSLIPMLTLAGAFMFLGERLSDRTFVGFILLITATVILSGGGRGRPNRETIWLAVTSALLFAVSSVTAKAAYDAVGFLSGFVVSRFAAIGTAVLILTVADRQAGREVLLMFHPSRRSSTSKRKQPGMTAVVMAFVGQSLGAVGFLFVQWAIAKGSATVVNAMQAVQYALLVLAAFVLRHRAPQLLGENLTRRVLVLKSVALALTAVGLALIV